MNKKYIALYNGTVQTSPDTWEVRPKTKICDENTTIKDILDWYEKNTGRRDIDAITITQAE